MLTELRISNFALIDQLHLGLPGGFLVLTGETGAGKSLLIDALLLLVGGRGSSDHIRFGADEALLEACFTLQESHPLVLQLRQDGFLLSDQHEIYIRRILSRSGKNRSYLNGQLAPLQTIQNVGRQLVDIHGQHDQQSLLSPKTQLELLDAYGGLKSLVGKFQQSYKEWKEKQLALETLQQRLQEQVARQDILQFQYEELTKIQLQVGEEEALSQEYHRLKHSGRLGELSNQSFETLYDGERSVLAQLQDVTNWVQELGQIDAQCQAWLPHLESAAIALQEVTQHLRDFRSQTESDPERMEVIDSRLAGLQRLKKKYGKTVEDLVELVQSLEEDLALLQQRDEQVANLQAEVANSFESMEALAKELSTKRKKASRQLAKQIQEEFEELKMGTMQIQVNLAANNEKGVFGPAGMDRLELLLAANPGEPPMPLGRIASGGELSRIMLALKTVFAGNDQTPVVIFDEIDSGVGGEAGMVMGNRLRQLAHYHQVFCITHLPQIASQAHAQFVVEKSTLDDRTLTNVQEVTGVHRESEIARMLGGGTITPTIKQVAVEMLKNGNREDKSSRSNKKSTKAVSKT
jgi:DNA repair protein RecN (Recombination protein N)